MLHISNTNNDMNQFIRRIKSAVFVGLLPNIQNRQLLEIFFLSEVLGVAVMGKIGS